MAKNDKYKQRKDGRYYARVSTGKYNDKGILINEYLYAKTSRELEKLINAKKYEIEHGIYAHDKGTTFGDYAEKWLLVAKATKSTKTQEMYKNIVDNHIDLIMHKKIKDITRSDVQMQINARIDKPRICQLIKITCKQILESAIDDGLILKNVCTKLEIPRSIPKEKRPLTEIEKTALKTAKFNDREKVLVYLAYGTGMRTAELYALTKSDFDFENNEINVSKSVRYVKTETFVSYPKTNNGIRTIQVPSSIMRIAHDYIESIDTLLLFCNQDGTYLTKAAYANIFNQALKKMRKAVDQPFFSDCSFLDLTPYVFRHNYCTELYYSGISLKEAQRLMGHADYNMIMKVYSHLDESKEKTKEKVERLAL